VWNEALQHRKRHVRRGSRRRSLTGVADITARLREIAERLRDPEVPDSEAEGLAREAADLVAQAGNEIERAARQLPSDRDV